MTTRTIVKAGTLATLIDGYIAGRSDVTEHRLGKFKNAEAKLIEWGAERFTVTGPTTKRYGKATRVVPIFPELWPFSRKLWASSKMR